MTPLQVLDSIDANGKRNAAGIYMILCSTNGKGYVGQAVHIRKRWDKHKGSLRRKEHDNNYLQNTWDKYGEEAFSFHVLENCLVEQLPEREKHWDSLIDRDLSFNLGEVGTLATWTGRKHSDETKRKMSLAQLGKPKSKEHVEKSRRGNTGKKRSEEVKQHMSLTRKGRKLAEGVAERRKAKYPTLSEESRQKMKSRLGKDHSPETRGKMAAARAAWWEVPGNRERWLETMQKKKTYM